MPDQPQNLTEDAARAGYAATINALWPGLHEAQVDWRIRIMTVRDQAAIGALRCQGDSYNILSEIQRLGTLYALAGMSNTQLVNMVFALEAMFSAARDLEKATR